LLQDEQGDLAEIANLRDLCKLREQEHSENCAKIRDKRQGHFEISGKLKDINEEAERLEKEVAKTG